MAYCPHHVRQSWARPLTRTLGVLSAGGRSTPIIIAPRLPPPQQQPSATTTFGWTRARTVGNLWGRSSSAAVSAAGGRGQTLVAAKSSASALVLRSTLSSFSEGTADCSSEDDDVMVVSAAVPASVAVDTNGSAAASSVEVEGSATAQATESTPPPSADTTEEQLVPLCLHEGLFSVVKPQNWTSNDVVAYLRGILERDARNRGAIVGRVGQANGRRRRNNNDRGSKNKNKIRVGHGGTLDPLATGVLVIGVGSGTKQLQNYLKGSKRYRATAELGYETTTLDMEGPVTRRESADHVTDLDQIQAVLPHFVGRIQQVPPLYSALKKDGVKLYEKARQGATVDEVEIEAREVEIYGIELRREHGASDPGAPPVAGLPKFDLDVECGGGTYIRSLVRDIGYKLGTCATTTYLERTKQGPFTISESLPKELWSAESIYTAIDNFNRQHASRNTTND